jgi:hypothetical protein
MPSCNPSKRQNVQPRDAQVQATAIEPISAPKPTITFTSRAKIKTPR